MKSEPIITTERLTLHEMEQSDFPALCTMLQDPEVMYAWERCFPDEESGRGSTAMENAIRSTAAATGLRSAEIPEKSSGRSVLFRKKSKDTAIPESVGCSPGNTGTTVMQPKVQKHVLTMLFLIGKPDG